MAEKEKNGVEQAKSKKKTVAVVLLSFLLTGGGIFLYMVIQGAEDLTKQESSFQFNSVMRQSVSPFFRFIGLAKEDGPTVLDVKIAKLMQQKEGGLDMDDWMQPGDTAGAGAASGNSPSRAAGGRSAGPSNIPRMQGGGLGGAGLRGGGGTSTSGPASSFARGADKSAVKIAPGGVRSGMNSGTGGTLSALRNAQAMLGQGLRSGSAMTAREKWDRSYGIRQTGGKGASGGNLSYGKQGLVDLDSIKSGDISNLKTTDPTASAAPAASPPTPVKEGGEDDIGKDLAKKASDGLGGSISNLLKGGGGSGGGETEGGKKEVPPPHVSDYIEKASGLYSKEPYDASEGPYKFQGQDKDVSYSKMADGTWMATISGEFMSVDPNNPANTKHYADYEITVKVLGDEPPNGAAKSGSPAMDWELVGPGKCTMPDGRSCPPLTDDSDWK